LRYSKIKWILTVVLTLNLTVALAKGLYGYFTHSVSMLADGFHSLFDAAASMVGLTGIYIAARPADKGHPYGHSKYETFASLAIGLLLAVAVFEILYLAYQRIITPTFPFVGINSFLIMVATIAINLVITTYENRQGRVLGSEILIADSLHTRSDIYASLAVIASLIAAKLGLHIVDIVVALGIAVLIGRAAWWVFKESIDTLSDKARLEIEAVKELAMTTRGVRDCHAIRTRGRENEIYLDLHLLVDPKVSVKEAHEISHQVEGRVKAAFRGVVDVVIHVEPYSA
jgi:cation diffusion facilitator family transporter